MVIISDFFWFLKMYCVIIFLNGGRYGCVTDLFIDVCAMVFDGVVCGQLIRVFNRWWRGI